MHQSAGRCKRGHLVLMAPLCTRGTSLSSTRRLASGCSALPPPAVTRLQTAVHDCHLWSRAPCVTDQRSTELQPAKGCYDRCEQSRKMGWAQPKHICLE